MSHKLKSFSKIYGIAKSHVFAGPLIPGAALIVKYCVTNISANANCITMKCSTIYLWLYDYWKVVADTKLDPWGALGRPPLGPPDRASRLISKVI